MERFSYLFLVIILFTTSCRLKKDVQNDVSSVPSIVTYADSTEASKLIITDDVDGFFDQISILEMEIQMKKTLKTEDKQVALASFKSFLKTQVSSWTASEKSKLEEVFVKVKEACDLVNPRIYPGDIKLIKIKTGHYGNDVYYTRGKCILIPENIFESEEMERQIPVMIHEVFHILSRYNLKLRNDLYGYIGFFPLKEKVKLAPSLQKIVLTNPDGVTMQYAMDLDSIPGKTMIVPLITSKFPKIKADTPAFFDYLNFDLYRILKVGDSYEVQANGVGKTDVNLKQTPTFFKKIKDNTQYIIHPDEIMADNFMLGILANESKDYSKFSPEGKVLIDKMLGRLKEL